ncbi:M14 family metallopeptidase [Azospirillum argentinense]|uniref:M14 family metallopeptidase n=1 Tax=Azospirillum argentinense TaxID=2970906 RepID=A0ABW8VGW5_9PROT
MEFTDAYARSYAGARRKFIDAATAVGASLARHTHPDARGPNGEELSVDVAVIGDQRARRAALILSGTHGQEGYAGSAAQIAWLGSGDPARLPADVAVVLVHALNPYGFAHGTRTTENNVDLNRNFVDHAAPYPENPGYARLHPVLIPEDWTLAALEEADSEQERFRAEHGADALFDALARGQYTHPDGLVYGGRGREWSNRTLEAIVRDHLEAAEKVAFIDWHTGIGDFAEPFFLCFNEDGGELFERAASWWGDGRVKGQRPHGLARPNYQGLVFQGVQAFLGGRPMVGAVIEFGTRGAAMRRALRLDQWLRFKAEPGTDRYAMLRDDMLDAFVPVQQAWRDATLRHGLAITRQAVAGLAAW